MHKLKTQEPYFVDFEIDFSKFKGQTTILTYKLPVHKFETALEIAEKYYLLNPKIILTLFIYKRVESIYKKSSRVNFILYQRIDINPRR